MRYLLSISGAIVGGLLGHLSGLPGGPLLGSLIAVALLHRWRVVGWPRQVFIGAQLLVGAAGGAMVTRSTVVDLAQPVLVGVGISAVVALVGAGCGLLLSRYTGVDRWSAIMAFAPGGLAELTAVAEDFEARTDVIVGVHLVRRVATIALVILVATFTL